MEAAAIAASLVDGSAAASSGNKKGNGGAYLEHRDDAGGDYGDGGDDDDDINEFIQFQDDDDDDVAVNTAWAGGKSNNSHAPQAAPAQATVFDNPVLHPLAPSEEVVDASFVRDGSASCLFKVFVLFSVSRTRSFHSLMWHTSQIMLPGGKAIKARLVANDLFNTLLLHVSRYLDAGEVMFAVAISAHSLVLMAVGLGCRRLSCGRVFLG